MTIPNTPTKTEPLETATELSYTVSKGDTLWSIAQKIYDAGFRWKDIAQANNITDRSNLKVGTILILPYPASSVQRKNRATVLNLTNWKLTLPIGLSENPIEIKQPELGTYEIDPWFIVAPDSGVRFRAPVNGVTTSGSNYPRSELREMTNDGEEKASWSSSSGTHTMFLDQSVTAVPMKKKHVVAGQIHDAKDDIIVIRLEYPDLYVHVDGKNVYKLDSSYVFGKRFTIQFVVNGDQTKVYYNNSTDAVYTLNKDYSDAYFKAGAYIQSNCSKEGSSSSCSENNYGEVVVYQAIITHR